MAVAALGSRYPLVSAFEIAQGISSWGVDVIPLPKPGRTSQLLHASTYIYLLRSVFLLRISLEIREVGGLDLLPVASSITRQDGEECLVIDSLAMLSGLNDIASGGISQLLVGSQVTL